MLPMTSGHVCQYQAQSKKRNLQNHRTRHLQHKSLQCASKEKKNMQGGPKGGGSINVSSVEVAWIFETEASASRRESLALPAKGLGGPNAKLPSTLFHEQRVQPHLPNKPPTLNKKTTHRQLFYKKISLAPQQAMACVIPQPPSLTFYSESLRARRPNT